jgi:hypothetical protein
MRPTRLAVLVAVVLLASVAVPFLCPATAQEQQPPALPLPEMQRLAKLYTGTWNYTETYPKSPMTPNGGTNTGVYTCQLGPGGNSIFNHFHSKGAVGEFDGAMIMTWDPQAQAYKAYAFGDSFPGALVETGQWEGDALVFRTELSLPGKKLMLRNSTRFLEGGRISSDEYSSADGKPETLVVHVDAVRK